MVAPRALLGPTIPNESGGTRAGILPASRFFP